MALVRKQGMHGPLLGTYPTARSLTLDIERMVASAGNGQMQIGHTCPHPHGLEASGPGFGTILPVWDVVEEAEQRLTADGDLIYPPDERHLFLFFVLAALTRAVILGTGDGEDHRGHRRHRGRRTRCRAIGADDKTVGREQLFHRHGQGHTRSSSTASLASQSRKIWRSCAVSVSVRKAIRASGSRACHAWRKVWTGVGRGRGRSRVARRGRAGGG